MTFKGTALVYFLQISRTLNENWIPLLYLLINCISAKSAPHMLFIDDEYSLFFVKCLIIGLCNLCVNCWFNQILLLIAVFSIEHLLPKVADVYQTISKPL